MVRPGETGEMEEGDGCYRASMESTDIDFLPIQKYSRPATPDNIAFERDVLILSNGKTEDELNRHYRLLAQDLGMEGEPRKSQVFIGGSDGDIPDSTLTVGSSVRNSTSLRNSLSQASQSTAPTSCDSTEGQDYHSYLRSPPAAPKQAPPSLVSLNSQQFAGRPPSVMSSRSIASSIKSGWRRISGLSKRKSNTIPTTESVPSIFSQNPGQSSRSSIATTRPPTSGRPLTGHSTATAKDNKTPKTTSSRPPSVATFVSYHDNVPPMLSPRSSQSPSLYRGKSLPSIASSANTTTETVSSRRNFSVPFQSGQRSKSSEPRPSIYSNHTRALSTHREEDYSPAAESKAAQARTARNRDMQRLRASQLAEQGRFLSFQADQAARLVSRHRERVRGCDKLWAEKEQDLEERHASRISEIEVRSLNAELELERTLEVETRTVEARLRHMEGYVSGRGIYNYSPGAKPANHSPEEKAALLDGSATLHLDVSQFPKREVSSHSMQMLSQQRRLRKQLPQLHIGRINVLREQQAKKMQKIQAKQAEEWDEMMAEKDEAAEDAEAKKRLAEEVLRQEFEARKERMEWRWRVTEQLERRRLQDERGVVFAELPKVYWGPNSWKGTLRDD